jgi:PiT family inorganic phosphate transporter
MLIATCTGVSFAHGSNDGQKGMGLIMLILVGTCRWPCAEPHHARRSGAAVCRRGRSHPALVKTPLPAPVDPRPVLSDYVRSKQATPQLIPPSPP